MSGTEQTTKDGTTATATATTTAALSRDEEARLVERLYSRAVAQRASDIAELDARYYPTVPPRHLSTTALARSVARQHDEEMQRRAQRRAEAAAAATASAAAATQHRSDETQPRRVVLRASELDESVERLYTQSLQRRQAKAEEQQQRAQAAEHDARPHTTLSQTQLQASLQRLCVPKKTTYTVDEINAIYGLS